MSKIFLESDKGNGETKAEPRVTWSEVGLTRDDLLFIFSCVHVSRSFPLRSALFFPC